ncbi:MAG: dihydrofolate reductase family protein [Verrucomicrobiota bacterium]|nr:dihydrofolate reductase family protein [Verrucomicrobiota bacterium]
MSLRWKVQKAGLPFVFSNFAMTADGKIAFASREFIPFGGRRDREHMLELRAQADAVMAGARTVNSPGITLGPGGEKYRRLRRQRGLREYPLRIIVSGACSVEPCAEVFRHSFSPVIILTTRRAPEKNLRRLRGIAEVFVCGGREIHFTRALRWLREKWNVERMLCEGGGELHGALVRAGLVDELHVTICPKIFGGRQAPTVADGIGAARLAGASAFKLKSLRRIGDELFVVFGRPIFH